MDSRPVSLTWLADRQAPGVGLMPERPPGRDARPERARCHALHGGYAGDSLPGRQHGCYQPANANSGAP